MIAKTSLQNAQFSDAKQKVLDALGRNMGNITMACKAANVCRRSYYDWFDNDQAFRERVREIAEELLDFGENKFLTLVNKEVPSAVIHFAKTKLRSRGYGEVQQIEMTEPKPLSWLDED